MSTPKKRLFLAVNLSLATTRKIAEAAGRMRGAAAGKGLRVLWVPAANLHITLKFLGWASFEAVEAVRDRVGDAVKGVKGFELHARGAGAFPSESAARVLWVGVEDPSGGLHRLAADVEAAMEKIGFPRENRPFAAHVTIGRIKEGRGAEEVLAPFRETDFGSSSIREVVLYESKMKSSGSEYISLFRSPLDVPAYRAERQTREVEEEPTPNPQEEPDPNGG